MSTSGSGSSRFERSLLLQGRTRRCGSSLRIFVESLVDWVWRTRHSTRCSETIMPISVHQYVLPPPSTENLLTFVLSGDVGTSTSHLRASQVPLGDRCTRRDSHLPPRVHRKALGRFGSASGWRSDCFERAGDVGKASGVHSTTREVLLQARRMAECSPGRLGIGSSFLSKSFQCC